MEALQLEERYTYSDYCKWNDGDRWELIDGKAYAMSPAPSWKHQGILGELHGQIRNYLKGKPCKVFVAPFDVRLNADTGDDTVVQPDIVVICDRTKICGTGSVGAPDMVIEILSPATSTHDRVGKYKLYLQYGVREYWIVDPDGKSVTAHVLDNGRYYTIAYADSDIAPVHVLEGCEISLTEVFEEID